MREVISPRDLAWERISGKSSRSRGSTVPGIVDANAKGACLLQHPEDLLRAHLQCQVSPVLAKAAAQVAPGVYAMREDKRPSSNPHLPEGLAGHANWKGFHVDYSKFALAIFRQID